MKDHGHELRDDHVAFAKQLTAWLDKAGVRGPISGADFADIVFGARKVDGYLRELLQCDLQREGDVDRAATLLGAIHAWLFSELKSHLADLETAWPSIETRVEQLSAKKTS